MCEFKRVDRRTNAGECLGEKKESVAEENTCSTGSERNKGKRGFGGRKSWEVSVASFIHSSTAGQARRQAGISVAIVRRPEEPC